ncbi:MAG: DUF3347 domain-containing protein [Cyclobacteriaceae bacterium]
MFISNSIKLLFLAFILALAACNNQAQEDDSAIPGEEAPKELSSEEQNLINVVDGYLLLKDALVASNHVEAQAKATSMLEVIDATNMMEVQQSTKHIAAAPDLDTQRAYFDSLSVNLLSYVENQPGEERTLYKQYCPMAFNNRGAYWLSNAQEIRNPYFGDQMLKCGRVEETLTY